MKIAMIGHKRIPSREGGVEIVVEELATRLARKGNTIDVYNRKNKKAKKIRLYNGVNIITIPTINTKALDALIYSFFATIRALLKKYDVIHYHAEGPCVMLFIPHLFGIKTVATIHGLDWQRAKWGGFATKYLKLGEKIAAKYADEIIVLSKEMQDYFEMTYQRNTSYIPNGVNLPTIREANSIEKKYNLKKDDYILFLARIVPEKGLHYLIEAFKQIQTNKKLVIAGDSSHSNDYVETIKEMVKSDKRIIMTGFVEGEELKEFYSNAYAYCLPSDIEGMPISLLEAMSYGNTCLISNIPESRQVVDKYAMIFEKGNVSDLKEKLEEMLKKQKMYSSDEIQNYVLEKYNWDVIVEQTQNIYGRKKEKDGRKNRKRN